VGFDLAPEYWGNGYMNEVMKTIITFAKDIMKVVKINACVYPENDNSIKLLEKHGFVFNGQMKDEVFRGVKYPHKIYVLQEEIMNYIKTNKAAWEEVFDNRINNYGENNHEVLKSERFAFFDSDLKELIQSMDFRSKQVAQFCCNNGRELLSLVLDGGAASGTGFDIATNILAQAVETAERAGITNCEFVNCNILEIPEKYHDKFDFIFFTIGAIVWFKDLKLLFEKAGKCLKAGGTLLINDGHPFCFMLAHPGEPEFDENNLKKFDHSYFRKEPWVGNQMGYIAGDYENKSSTFTDYSHTLGDIINALSANGMKTVKLDEYDYDVSDGNLNVYKGTGVPLSYILVAEKT
jgi:ubiquinone/menaquinone biosynthesis C-methylase UbiE